MKQKLTEKKVKVIMGLFEETELTDTEIGNIFDISREQINQIRNGRRWTDVTGYLTPDIKKLIEEDALKALKEIREIQRERELRSNDFRDYGKPKEEYKDKYYDLIQSIKELL